MLTLDTLLEQLESKRLDIAREVNVLKTVTIEAIDIRKNIIDLEGQLFRDRRAFEESRATLLTSGAVEGKNAEIREANIRLTLIHMIEAVESLELAVKLGNMQLASRLLEVDTLKESLRALVAEFGWIGGPSAFALAIDGEQKKME